MFTKKSKYDLKLLQSIRDLYINKTTKIRNDDNILIKYLKSPDIIKDFKTNNLSLFINELNNQIEISNIILPFIDPIRDLIDIYLNTTDNKIDKNTWEKLFIKLFENSFFNRENLIPIYSYFTELYSDVGNLKNSDEKIIKFNKYIDLWKWIYLNSANKASFNNPISTFCSLGSGLELILPIDYPSKLSLNIRIKFINEDFLDYVNPYDAFIKIGDEVINYNYLIKRLQNKKIRFLDFQFKYEYMDRVLRFYINRNEIIHMIYLKNKNHVTFLHNFFGQIENIIIWFYDYTKYSKFNIKTLFPYPIKDNEGFIFSSDYKIEKNINRIVHIPVVEDQFNNPYDKSKELDFNFNFKLKIQNIKLFKTNFINYKEAEFDIINYFGGIIQFLPFLNIINGLYNNREITFIDKKDKNEVLIDFAKNILLVIYNYANSEKNEKLQILENYWTFFLYIINKIEPFQSEKIKIDINEFMSNSTNKKTENIFSNIIIHFLKYIIGKNKSDEKFLIDFISKTYCDEKKKENRNDNLNLFSKTNNQLYRHILKQLFVYNRLWSKQYLFFKNFDKSYNAYFPKKESLEIKYKRLNYYTTNFQQPLIYPILEIENYYPIFSKFEYENLYKKPTQPFLNYDFSLNKFKDILNHTFIKNFLDNDNKGLNNSYKCCLVKKLYHVQGRMGWIIKNDNNNDANFIIYFLSDLEFSKDTCNNDNSNLCHGSVFPFMEKENNRLIYLPKEKIVFIIIRIYYFRISAIEIFTIENKSYYFNFKEEFAIPIEHSKNKIIQILHTLFKPIKKNKSIFGWYNPIFQKIFFPLFSENIDVWKEKHTYSNFDKLMIINLFSNRSFCDLNQYPVFPMLYNEIDGLKRQMDRPIGFQEINEESISRTKLIKDSYYTEKDYNEDSSTELCYFSILFSNISFVCNYLIRVYPYSYISIEIQGDRFDTPDRLFFSINSTMHNTLTQRSDLRELIPEMFYFPPLFSNMNKVELGKLRDGSNIDNVYIKDKNEDKIAKYIFLKNMKNNLETEEKLDKWIDLIFGINKDFDENKERYYSSNNNVEFITKPQKTNDDLMLQSCEFGVLPYKLFDDKFPTQNKINAELEIEINEFNFNEFKNEHINCLFDEKISFICKGEKGINSKYFDSINKSKNENKLFGGFLKFDFFSRKSNNDKIDIIHYLFTGDSLGNLCVYVRKPIKECENLKFIEEDLVECSPERYFCENIYNKNFILLNKLSDHTKEIIYIDYNPRLNLLADYSLDGFINIYVIPSIKLIRTIQTKDLNIPGKIIKIAIASNPLPMLCIASDEKIFVLDINGEFIKSIDNVVGKNVNFLIDKNFGRVTDKISITETFEKSIDII